MSRLPTLGPRGEGWLALQLVLLGLVFVTGLPGALEGAFSLAGGSTLAARVLVAAGLVVAGLVLAVWGTLALGRSFAALPQPPPGAELVESGPYRWVRHPIYLGLLVGSLGWGVLAGSLVTLGLTMALAVLLDLKARREEAWLAARFPDYADYRRRTRRLVPFLY
ncbi:MAG TPA: isoprenylcysteine carboxylmethyltransferase family protein [Candidatus Limnocylindrales bacterium]|nr:isoprenylcysteine carboxylmethyltransferase family protein [Candidatus Limnocylindrales bacterium]